MTEDKFSILKHPWIGEKPFVKELTDKQWKILKAALKVFTEKGYSASTTSEIAREAGVAEGTIFRHFKNKKEILLATLVPLMQNFVGPGVTNSLHDLLLEYDQLPLKDVFLLILEDRQKHITSLWPLLRVVIIEANYHPELKEVLLNNLITSVQETFLTFLRQRQDKGELRKDLDTGTMMRSVVGAFGAYLAFRALFPERNQGHESRQELKAIVDLFLQGAQSNVRS